MRGTVGARGGARPTRTAPDYLHPVGWPEAGPPGPPRPFYSRSSAATAAAAEVPATEIAEAISGNSARRRAVTCASVTVGAGPRLGFPHSFQGQRRGVAIEVPSHRRSNLGGQVVGRSVWKKYAYPDIQSRNKCFLGSYYIPGAL